MSKLREVYVISFEKADIDERTFLILKDSGLEFETVGNRIDMEESDFFNFEELCSARGITLPVDGGNSWGKWV